jgi:hypothetical protein
VEKEVVGQPTATLDDAVLDAGACGAAMRVVEEAAAARVGGPWRRRSAAGALKLRPDVQRERRVRGECG